MAASVPRRGLLVTLAVLLAAACSGEDGTTADPTPTPTETQTPKIQLQDIDISSDALGERVGIFVCGDSIVASPPAGFVEADTFVVFDRGEKTGEITRVELPKDLAAEPNARWLLNARCAAETDRGPILVVGYQEMPLAEKGGVGVLAAYTLDGRELWMRDDINQPARLVDGVLVVGAFDDQPEQVVDVATGETIAEFGHSSSTREVLLRNRMIVRQGPSVLLKNLQGKPIRRIDSSTLFTSDENLIFGVDPGQIVDAETGEQVEDPKPEELPSDEPTSSPTDGPKDNSTTEPAEPTDDSTVAETKVIPGEVTAYRASDGQRVWSYELVSDPLAQPTVDPHTGVVVLVDARYVVHGIDPVSGELLWDVPTEVEHPRVTADKGVVLIDQRRDDYQALLDARSGLPLPEPEETIVDLTPVGALEMIDGVATLVPIHDLRNPPTETPEESPTG